jgi:hypothetical protein
MQKKLEQLCADLIAAKDAEVKAGDDRVAIERQILQLTGVPDEGAATTECDGYKVKVDQRIIRKVDDKAYALIVDQIPEAVRPITYVETAKVDTKGLRWLRDNEPGLYKLVCTALEEKPAKPAVKVEVLS